MTSNANINGNNISDIDNELETLLTKDVNLDLLGLLVNIAVMTWLTFIKKNCSANATTACPTSSKTN